MSFVNEGVCPKCGRVLMFYVAPDGTRTQMMCKCEREERQQQSLRREATAKTLESKRKLQLFMECVGERYKDKSFSNYNPAGKNKEHYLLIMDMAKHFDKYMEKGTGALLYGHYGCGKTHLEIALGRLLAEQDHSVKMFGTSALYSRYMSAYSWRERETPNSVIEDACDCDLLILDDFGVDIIDTDKSNFERFCYALINYRYNQKKPVVISTNLKPEELKQLVTMRVYDRLRAMVKPAINHSLSGREEAGKD